MAFDPDLDSRLADLLTHRSGFQRRIMFGGPGYFLHSKMCVGVYKHFLIVRLGKDQFEVLSDQFDELRPMDITGKPMKGWGMIDGQACDFDDFKTLVDAAEAFVKTLV